MSFSYATPGSGPSAGGIGWFNFQNLTMNPGDSLTGLTGTLNDGTVVTFDMSLSLVSGTTRSFVAKPVPTFPGANFGTAGYTGLLGNVAMYGNLISPPGTYAFTISNISVKDSLENPIPNYTVIVADAEQTNLGESWIWNTNGGAWQQLAQLGGNPPTLTGLGTATATITGTNLVQQSAYVLTTQTPSQLVLTAVDGNGSRQGFSIGFATTRVSFRKNVGDRLDAADQFVLNIAGTPNNQATTSGTASGIQAQTASIYAIPGNTYTLNEAMAPGSVSPLTAYTRVLSASNATPAGSVPPTGALPVNFTPALGDNVTYTILNAVPETFVKTVDKAYADVGDVLTYTVTIDNQNDFPVSNVLMTDATPAGTTYVGNLLVSAPYTGTTPAGGITISSIPANGSATVSWQVKVNTAPPIPTPITNAATVSVPGGTSGSTNVVTTQVSLARIVMTKASDPSFVQPGDVVTYTITLNNVGNAAANNVVVTDVLPAGAALVPGSVTGATGTPPALTLTSPIPAGGSAVVTYQLKVGANVPNPNPMLNTASAAYTYTVNPAEPNGASGTAASNTASVQVNQAKLSVVKNADKSISYIGEVITYQIAVKNSGNVPADNVVLTDLIPDGAQYLPGSLTVSEAATGDPTSAITLTAPIDPGATVSISFQVQVTDIPNPNPLVNTATADYAYTVDPALPDGVTASAASNPVDTLVFRYNFSQQITDLIDSVALEEAALAAVANAEGAKIQAMVAMGDVTAQELLCLNKSVADMMDSISTLEDILRKKLNAVSCQINSMGAGCM